MSSKSFSDFDRGIKALLVSFGAKEDRSTGKVAKSEPLLTGENLNFWLGGSATKRHWDSNRTAGYLAAYVRFAGPEFPASGIRTREGYVWLDRGVICSLLVGQCICLVGTSFRVTDKGRALIAPFVRLSDDNLRH